jgi:hypothetical protein
MQARAAIREVAAWLREQHDGDLVAATVLDRQAGPTFSEENFND